MPVTNDIERIFGAIKELEMRVMTRGPALVDEQPWIRFEGGKCPVPLDTRVQLMWRDGEPSNSGIADLWDWDEDGIVGYRVVEQIARADLYDVAAAIIGPGCDIVDWYESDHPAIDQARRVIQMLGARV